MEKIIKHIKAQLPKVKKGFSLKKTQEIYIPYLEIGIECLIRDISEINLFFETILSLINICVTDINEISNILGVSFEIIKEVIVDMVEADYVSVSENKLSISEKGKDVLKTKKLIEIKKKYMNKVMIDLITGDIYDGSNKKIYKIDKYDVCLDTEIEKISKSFLDSKYGAINKVFQEQESDDSFGKQSVNKELYKIIDISYEKLVYVKNKLFIYQRDNSDDIEIEIENDINHRYLNSLYKQLREGTHPCLEHFFERDYKFLKQHSASIYYEPDLIDNTKKIYADLLEKENIDLKLFMKKRCMLTDKEYINYFLYSDELSFDKLIISTNKVRDFLTVTIFDEIKRISLKKPVILIYDKNEFNAKNQIEYYLSANKKNKNIFIIPSENLDDCKVFFVPSLGISIEENIIHAFSKEITYKSGILDFTINSNNEEIKTLLKNYKIDELIANQITKRKRNNKFKKK